jgi:2,5-diamino-6-(ribosylamino)-4(3H)-pyrimidinone 5'-phosphate reductase
MVNSSLLSRPQVTVLVGVSIDGRISLGRGQSSRLFDEGIPAEVREPLYYARAHHDAVMVGINTVLIDNPRLKSVENPDLVRIVVDGRGRITPQLHMVDGSAPTIVLTTNVAAPQIMERLRGRNVEIFAFGTNTVHLRRALHMLAERNIRRLLVEGGGRLIASLLAQQCVDELQLVIFPFTIGDRDAPSLIEGDNLMLQRFQLEECRVLGEHYVFLRYVVKS